MYYINTSLDTDVQYDMAKFMPFVDDFYDIMYSSFIEEIRKLDYDGKYVLEADDNSPSKLAYRIYRDTQYWWILMAYNDMVTLDDFFPGRVIFYPFPNKIHKVYFELKANEAKYGLVVEE